MRKIIIISLCLLAFAQAKAQFSISYYGGYASYDMKDMKDLHKMLQETWINEANAVYADNFEGGIAHTIDIGYRLNKGEPKRNIYEVSNIYEIGLKGSFYNTKGHVYSQSEPDTYNSTFDLSAIRGGIYIRDYFYNRISNDHIKLSVFYEISPAIIFSRIKQEAIIRAPYSKLQNNTCWSVLGQLGLRYYVTPAVGINATIGYDFTPGADFYTENSRDINPSDKWAGIRASVGVSYTFKK